jgi:hypothetical protein
MWHLSQRIAPGVRFAYAQKKKDFCSTCDEYETCEKVKPYRGGRLIIARSEKCFSAREV